MMKRRDLNPKVQIDSCHKDDDSIVERCLCFKCCAERRGLYERAEKYIPEPPIFKREYVINVDPV